MYCAPQVPVLDEHKPSERNGRTFAAGRDGQTGDRAREPVPAPGRGRRRGAEPGVLERRARGHVLQHRKQRSGRQLQADRKPRHAPSAVLHSVGRPVRVLERLGQLRRVVVAQGRVGARGRSCRRGRPVRDHPATNDVDHAVRQHVSGQPDGVRDEQSQG